MEGFWRLSNARPQGFNGLLRIPLSEIEAYIRIKSFGYEKRQDFLFYVERLDEKYMEYIAKAMEAEKNKHGNKGEPPARNARPH